MPSLMPYKQEEDGGWITVLGIIAIVVLFGWISFSIIQEEKECQANKRSCSRFEKQIQCEDAGGIFYHGSAFSTPNCVFPPVK